MVSNKTLAFFLVLAVIASIGGLFISLDRLSRMMQITGYASSGTGTANVTIIGVNSISIVDNLINFGACTPNPSTGSLVSSNDTSTLGICLLNASKDNITITNDGNNFVNLTLQSSVTAATLIGGTGPSVLFTAKNASANPGCAGQAVYCGGSICSCSNYDNCTLPRTWFNITAATTNYRVCGNMTYGATSNTVEVYVQLFLPYDTPPKVNSQATLTFTASTP